MRQIRKSDIPAVTELLARGFPAHGLAFWQEALAKLSDCPTVAGFPQYGYLLESDDVVVGAILAIFSERPQEDAIKIQCNLSSWFVDPAFRPYGSLLASKALGHKNVTYLNITPAVHTLPILQAQGYSRYSKGIFFAAPALQIHSSKARVTRAALYDYPPSKFDPFEHKLLAEHIAYGCLSLWCVTADRAFPFVFRPRVHKGFLPYVQLIYCRDLNVFVQFAGPLGRFLIKRGWPLVMIDANGPICGLIGKYRDGKQPKYFKGPERPRLGDLAYTEVAIFGL